MRNARTWELRLDRWMLVGLLTAALDLLYAATLALPGNWQEPTVRICVLGTLAAFVAIQATAFAGCVRRGVSPGVTLSIRKIHVLQFFCFHAAFYFYWGAYWPATHAHLPLIAAQLAFACLFDSTLGWVLRRSFRFGFAAFPIVGSINLFLWFRPGHFEWQLLVVAGALLSKVLFTVERDGRRVHLFNPSALPMAIAAIVLLATRSWIAYGTDIPTSQELGPHVYEVIFLIGLAINVWFPTVLMTSSIFVTIYLLNKLSVLALGAPSYDLQVFAPTFLGATLLVSDPATSPHSRPGKVLAGVCYGALVYVIPALLFEIDLPSSSEKVLAVPIVNLLVPWFDRFGPALSRAALGAWPRLRERLESHAVHLAAWSLFFVLVSPGLKVTSQAYFHPPRWVLMSPEALSSRARVKLMCERRPEICRRDTPAGFLTELRYLLGNL